MKKITPKIHMTIANIAMGAGVVYSLADMLINDIKGYVADLEKLEYPTESRIAVEKKCCHHRKWHLFSHTGR